MARAVLVLSQLPQAGELVHVRTVFAYMLVRESIYQLGLAVVRDCRGGNAGRVRCGGWHDR